MDESGDTIGQKEEPGSEDAFRAQCAERGAIFRYFLFIGLVFFVDVESVGVWGGLWNSSCPDYTRPLLTAAYCRRLLHAQRIRLGLLSMANGF